MSNQPPPPSKQQQQLSSDISPSGKLASEKVVVSAPMSFAGSAQRVWKITDQQNTIVKGVLSLFAVVLVLVAWSFVSVWYLFFGILLIPYRLIRRGNRKDKVKAIQHREQLEAMAKIQQQQTLQTANLIEQTKVAQKNDEPPPPAG